MAAKETLLILLFFCHFLADFTHLSTGWMLTAKRLGKPGFPIFCHASVHGVLMFHVLLFFTSDIPLIGKLVLLQVTSHFLIDVWKGRMNGWFPAVQNPANKWHWVLFGFDQFLHAVVIIFMAFTVFRQ